MIMLLCVVGIVDSLLRPTIEREALCCMTTRQLENAALRQCEQLSERGRLCCMTTRERENAALWCVSESTYLKINAARMKMQRMLRARF